MRCPLCDLDFGDKRVTGFDATPYAQAYVAGSRGWRTMAEWVWFAGWERLKHLALTRSSAASRRFARLNLGVLAIALAVFQGSRGGWRWVPIPSQITEEAVPSVAAESLRPQGTLWLLAAAVPSHERLTQPREGPVTLWWNPWISTLNLAVAFLFAVLLFWMGVALIRGAATKSLLPMYRADQRLTAAIHYGTAWALPVAVGLFVLGLRPVSYIGKMNGWSFAPPSQAFVVASGIVAGLGVVTGWFWLIRLATCVPSATKSRAVAFFVLGVPIIAAVTGCTWWFGVRYVVEHGIAALKLTH